MWDSFSLGGGGGYSREISVGVWGSYRLNGRTDCEKVNLRVSF